MAYKIRRVDGVQPYFTRRLALLTFSMHPFGSGLQSSRPGELPPEPLTEPYVNLSIHTALRKLKSKRVTALPVIEEFRVFSIDSPEPFP